jgi:hypothetical protein
MSENLQRRIDEAVKKLSSEAYEVALRHVRDNREAIDRIVEVLMEKETIGGDQFRSMLAGAPGFGGGGSEGGSERASAPPAWRSWRGARAVAG